MFARRLQKGGGNGQGHTGVDAKARYIYISKTGGHWSKEGGDELEKGAVKNWRRN